MARSSTTVVKGQQLALKHGGYSASGKLALQNRVISEARQRLKDGKLTPLEADAVATLEATKKRLAEVSQWLDDNGGPLTPRGRVRAPANLEQMILKSVAAQTMALWRMLLATQPALEDQSASSAQAYFAQQYGTPETPRQAGPA